MRYNCWTVFNMAFLIFWVNLYKRLQSIDPTTKTNVTPELINTLIIFSLCFPLWLFSEGDALMQLAFYHQLVTRWRSFGLNGAMSKAIVNVSSSNHGDQHLIFKFISACERPSRQRPTMPIVYCQTRQCKVWPTCKTIHPWTIDPKHNMILNIWRCLAHLIIDGEVFCHKILPALQEAVGKTGLLGLSL